MQDSAVRDYYHSEFRADLAMFLGDTPVPYFGHAWNYSCSQLNRVDSSRRPEFIICLYFTVLVDQAMHAHFRSYYPRFAELTRYPKFCHGLGQFQLNPRGILSAPVEQGIVAVNQVRDLIGDGMQLFVEEVMDFLSRYMPQISAHVFFDRLLHDPDVQIPLLVVRLNPDLNGDVVWIAYDALCKAVREHVPSEEH